MNSLLVWPVTIPLLTAAATLVWPRRASALGLAGLLATLVASVPVVVRSSEETLILALGGWAPGLGIALRADPLASVFLLMSAMVMSVAGIYAARYFTDSDMRARFWPLWLLLVTSQHALLLAADLFNVYVGLELLGLAAVALAALGGTADAVRAALRYLLAALLGSMAFLAGVGLVYAAHGTLDMVALKALIAPSPAAWTALALLSAGLLIKCAVFPLHFWLPQAHANAPAPVSGALSALVVKIAFYLLLRLWLEIFLPLITPAAAWLLGWLGALAVVWGSWQALRSARLKVLAAYSTVAQMGYLLMFFPLLVSLPRGAAWDTAFGALVVLALAHGFAKSGFFLAAGVIQQQAGHDRIAEFAGLARQLPVTTFSLALAGIALIGLPPSGTFLGKWALLAAAMEDGQWAWVVVVGAGTVLGAGYVFRVLGHAFAPADGQRKHVDPLLVIPSLILALIASVILGFGSASLWAFLGPDALAGEGPT